MAHFGNDLRHSVRILIATPGFSIMTILMLALGIGACTAIFTVMNAVLLRPLPYPDPNSLVQLWELSDRARPMRLPEANFLDWKSQSRSFQDMAMFGASVQPIAGGSEPVRARVAEVSQGFFSILKVPAMVGTTFLPEHIRPDAAPAIVVSYGLWQRTLGGASELSSKRVTFQNKSYAVIGVMPPSFSFPPGTDAWIPRETNGRPVLPSRTAHNWSVIARIKPGIPLDGVSSDVNAIARRIHEEYSDLTAVGAVAIPLKEQLTQSVRVALPVLFAAVGVLLLIACANVTNLILIHTSSRQQELAVRTALGASRQSLVRLFLCQTLLLTAVGGALGTLLSFAGVRALLTLGSNLPSIDEIHTDWRVLIFAIGVSLTAGIILGILPAIRAGRVSVSEALKQSGRCQHKGGTAPAVRRLLLASQVALTVMLLVGAGLLGRSLFRVMQIDLGFQTENRIAIDILLPQELDAKTRQRDADRYQQLLKRISTMLGITTVGGTGQLPLSGNSANGQFRIDGGKTSGAYWPVYRVATPGYFQAINIPLLRGRLFDETDGASTPQVAVISKTVADTVWPGQDPIGQRINYANFDGDPNFMTVVGIVADVRSSPEIPALGDVYVHYLQRGAVDNFTLVIHAAGQPENVAQQIISEVRAMNSEASTRVQTMDQMFSSNMANRRFNFALLTAFAGAALVLALMGVYSVTAYSVAQRTQEIGIRLALGAPLGNVTRLFLAEGAKIIFVGVVTGLMAAAAASRLLQSLLFGVQTSDVPSYVIAVLPLVVVGLIASLLPARRASRVDPMTTIRHS